MKRIEITQAWVDSVADISDDEVKQDITDTEKEIEAIKEIKEPSLWSLDDVPRMIEERVEFIETLKGLLEARNKNK